MKTRARIVCVSAACTTMLLWGAAAWGAPAGLADAKPAATHSAMWAGYVATGTTFTVARATWKEPTLTCSSTASGAVIEVGLDGYSSPTVEEAGSVIVCSAGSPVYILWYRDVPGSGTGVDTISAGDKLTASVTYKGGTFTYAVKDSSEPSESFSASTACGGVTCARSSAEWVVETGTTPEPLAHFKPVHFTGGSATDGASVKGPIDDTAWTHTQLDMVDGSAKTMAASGALNAAGSGFAVTWKGAT